MRFLLVISSLLLCFSAVSGDFIMGAERLPPGFTPVDKSCTLRGEQVFSSDAWATKITDELSYTGEKSLQMTIKKGKSGFGSFGGIVYFPRCLPDTPRVYKGEEIWVRLRVFVPEGFEYNRNGRNKFLRFRTYHKENGKEVSEGYNDLYLDATKLDNINSTPFDFIFEGKQRWYKFGVPADFLEYGKWETIEYYLKLDDKIESEGGDSTVRVWKNGKLIGETKKRATLKTPDSYVSSLYLFTYWDNAGAHVTQSLYVDDIYLTTNIPQDFDKAGNRMIGLGEGHTQPWQTAMCPVEI